ncbi:hypothetical protein [Roseococcus microcysteis]|uniref:hypothetical protein n=1 Tax=Roseococcus microcysteis TaxID=2771361 RepID=UPI00168B89EC|nr:hypothetical protein [Roseococcus microcysteis]
MTSLLRVLVGFTVILAVLALPFAVAVVVASGHKVMEDGAWLRGAGLAVLAVFPVVAVVLAWVAWRRRETPRAGFARLAGVPVWGALGAALLVVAQLTAPPAAPVARPPEDLRALAGFLADPSAPLVLDLRGRGLRHIPDAVLADRRLHELDLRDNNLTALPDALKSNPALRLVRIGGNPIPPEEVRRFGLALLAADNRMVISN